METAGDRVPQPDGAVAIGASQQAAVWAKATPFTTNVIASGMPPCPVQQSRLYSVYLVGMSGVRRTAMVCRRAITGPAGSTVSVSAVSRVRSRPCCRVASAALCMVNRAAVRATTPRTRRPMITVCRRWVGRRQARSLAWGKLCLIWLGGGFRPGSASIRAAVSAGAMAKASATDAGRTVGVARPLGYKVVQTSADDPMVHES